MDLIKFFRKTKYKAYKSFDISLSYSKQHNQYENWCDKNCKSKYQIKLDFNPNGDILDQTHMIDFVLLFGMNKILYYLI